MADLRLTHEEVLASCNRQPWNSYMLASWVRAAVNPVDAILEQPDGTTVEARRGQIVAARPDGRLCVFEPADFNNMYIEFENPG